MTGKWRRWTQSEIDNLLALRTRGGNWDDIALELKRASASCQNVFRKYKAAGTPRKPPKRRLGVFPKALPVQPAAPVLQVAAAPPSARRVSTHVLIADSELRSRIALQGLTAGLLGDPLPGRSALDERNAQKVGP